MKHLLATAGLLAAALLGAPSAIADFTSFTSPSGNIGCIMAADFVRCDIAERNWSPPPRPTDCPSFTGYGQGIDLGPTGPAAFVCAGDTTLGTGAALPYGQSNASGSFVCRSEPSGVACTNSEGRGFRLAREGYELT
jgi:hypothetical protein